MKYDLLITGGEICDPAAGLRGAIDVAIAGGKIAAVAWCVFTAWRQSHRHLVEKTKIFRVVAELGRWSKTDPFTIVFFVAVVFAVVFLASAGFASLAAAPRRNGRRRRRGFSSADVSAFVASTAGMSSMSMSGAESPTRRASRVMREYPELRSGYRFARSSKTFSTMTCSGSQPCARRRATSEPSLP